jgi:hypothetical protein
MYAVKRLLILCLVLAACGSDVSPPGETRNGAAATAPEPASPRLAHWTPWIHLDRPLDLAGPRRDGAMIAEAAGRLGVVSRSGKASALLVGYRSPGGEEPYIALAPAGCFGRGTIYAIRLRQGRGVTAVAVGRGVRRFASITAPGLIDGIAFDQTGGFGHRLLVSVNAGLRTTVVAIDCHGNVQTITGRAPRVEGGIAVAPSTFGRFGGDLIAPDEQGGRVFAITPRGRSLLVANSGLPHGGDIGVESAGFVPRGRFYAVLADRLTPGNPHPGDDVLLRLGSAPLAAAGVRPGDLLVATEGGARTDAIRCGPRTCQVRHVADGPAIAHAEGHIAFVHPG